MNVFGAAALPPGAIQNEDYDELLAWATENAEFVQFNHPASWRRTTTNEHVGRR